MNLNWRRLRASKLEEEVMDPKVQVQPYSFLTLLRSISISDPDSNPTPESNPS